MKPGNNSGMSLAGVLIAAGVMGVVLSGLMTMMSISAKQQAQSTLTFHADEVRRRIKTVLNHSASWDKTVADSVNSGLACLRPPGSSCTGSTDVVINKVVDSNDNVVHDTTAANSGYTLQGRVCPDFVAPPAAGNDQCPLRLVVRWTAECTGACINPRVRLKIDPIYNPGAGNRLAFNPGNYAADFYQGASGTGCEWRDVAGNLTEICGNVGIGTSNPFGKFHVEGGMTYLKPSSAVPSQGLYVDMTGMAGASNGVLIVAADGYSGNLISGKMASDANSRFAFTAAGGFYAPFIGNSAGSYAVCWDGPSSSGQFTFAGACASSDIKLKKNVQDLIGNLARIELLRPVEFEWKNKKRGLGPQIGLIAQEVESVFPELVSTNADGIKSLRYELLTAPLIGATQELHSAVKALKVENEALKSYICKKDPEARFCLSI